MNQNNTQNPEQSSLVMPKTYSLLMEDRRHYYNWKQSQIQNVLKLYLQKTEMSFE